MPWAESDGSRSRLWPWIRQLLTELQPRADNALEDSRLPHERVRFAHNSERQFAKLLDFYGVAWDYEPVEFVLERDRRGQPAAAFRPDFYLPGYDLFIEITTLNQKLVTKKNRKVRQLRQLYPGIDVKVLYQRDYLNLLVKYGLEEASQLAEAKLEAARPAERFDAGSGP